jgi:hypothetical protein
MSAQLERIARDAIIKRLKKKAVELDTRCADCSDYTVVSEARRFCTGLFPVNDCRYLQDFRTSQKIRLHIEELADHAMKHNGRISDADFDMITGGGAGP